MGDQPLAAGVELGGTKSIAVIARGSHILARASVPTSGPAETLSALRNILAGWRGEFPFNAIGIASFGPLQLSANQPDYGRMLNTPKPGWSGADVAKEIAGSFDCPWRIDTDVNGAALAEYRWGAGAQCSSVCYITIGTGLGGGLLVNGAPVHGAMHPEIGHIRIRRAPGDAFDGACPFHGDCIEGLVSGPALAARFGAPAQDAPDNHPVWDYVAADIAELAGIILLTTSAQRLLIGGGVAMSRPFVLPAVRDIVVERLSSYLPFLTSQTAQRIIRAPGLGADAGPLGAVALALAALAD